MDYRAFVIHNFKILPFNSSMKTRENPFGKSEPSVDILTSRTPIKYSSSNIQIEFFFSSFKHSLSSCEVRILHELVKA